MKKPYTPYLLLLPFFVLMTLILISIWNVLLQSLGYIPAFGLTTLTLDYYKAVFQQYSFVSALGVSLHIAFTSAILATILGVLLCYALVKRHHTKGSLLYMVRLPILMPHAVVAIFVVNLFSQTGLFARMAYAAGWIADFSQFPQFLYTESYSGAILAYLWKEIPFVAYFVLALMSSISDTLGEAAENLGASPWRSFFQITLPMSMPAILKAFLIIFIFAFGGYELPLLLGSTLPKALSVQTYLSYTSPDLLQRPLAMAMNSVMLLLSCALALLFASITYRLIRKIGVAK
jgi:putative spermidine/putrescine transport system permease protein